MSIGLNLQLTMVTFSLLTILQLFNCSIANGLDLQLPRRKHVSCQLLSAHVIKLLLMPIGQDLQLTMVTFGLLTILQLLMAWICNYLTADFAISAIRPTRIKLFRPKLDGCL
jgi:hypothetical protein